MAKRRQLEEDQQIRRAIEGAPELRPFIISNVRALDRQLGAGSYGSVEELEVDGLVCAGKRIYDILVDRGNLGAQNIVDKYYRECRLLSEIRHPNVVQFLGICFLPASILPVLVMERLQGSLDELLETTPHIPLPTKLAILHDVARGLVHLHNRSPSIIHRDLTARNVLLTRAMTAKIADLGNSRIADIPPGQLAQTMTQGLPGTHVYMPPEALSSNPRYGPSLDIFSFGHLSLFTATQKFPKDLLSPTYHDSTTNQIRGRSEIERRDSYVQELKQSFSKEHRSLVELIQQCLEYEPAKRPTAKQLLSKLAEIRADMMDPYSTLTRLELEKDLKEKEEEIKQSSTLQQQVEQLQANVTLLTDNCRDKNDELIKKEADLCQMSVMRDNLQKSEEERSGLEEECRGKEEELAAKEEEIAVQEEALSGERQRVATLAEECAGLKGRLEGTAEKIASLQAQVHTEKEEKKAMKEELVSVQQLRDQEIKEKDKKIARKSKTVAAKDSELQEKSRGLSSLQQRCGSLQTQLEAAQNREQSLEADSFLKQGLLTVRQSHINALQREAVAKDKLLKSQAERCIPDLLSLSLPLKWLNPIPIPSGMECAHSIQLNNTVYIGGGIMEGSDSKLFEFTFSEEKGKGNWKEILTSVCYFGLASVQGKLIICGGLDAEGRATNRVLVLDPGTRTWTEPYPPMPVACRWHSAVGYKHWMIVVGGHQKRSLEVLDTEHKRWFSLEFPLKGKHQLLRPSLAVLHDTLYIQLEDSTYYTAIPALLSDAISRSIPTTTEKPSKSTDWFEVSSLLSTPTLVTLRGHLLSVGGSKGRHHESYSSAIALLLPQQKRWIQVAELPVGRCKCACVEVSLPGRKEELMVIAGCVDARSLECTIDSCCYLNALSTFSSDSIE